MSQLFHKFDGKQNGVFGIQLHMFMFLMMAAPHDKFAWDQRRISWVKHWFPNFPIPTTQEFPWNTYVPPAPGTAPITPARALPVRTPDHNGMSSSIKKGRRLKKTH